ncbi:MAG: PQQ-binding-like beta-propeller repeat protein [Acidobacteriia bacterium]|nr:PQQ-binding-like beta-propeller repeat protein [Terriglobia bacterium]
MALLTVFAARAAAPDGESLYKQRCATCHDGQPQARMPSHQELAARTPESIYRAMFEGAMMPQSAGLATEEGRAIARFLTGKEFGASAGALAGKCATAPSPLHMSDADWNGWGYDRENTRYQPKPGLTAADVPNLKLKWAFAFEGDTVRAAQPAVVGNRVFTGSASGAVYSLDAATGCTWWKYDAGAMVRNAISIGQAGGKSIAYFGDVRSTVHALDLATGQLLWKVKVEDHPAARITGSPAFYGGRLYVPVSSIEEASAMLPTYECCKFRGSIVALDGATGKQIWKSFSVVDPPRPLAGKNAAGAQLWGPAGAAIWSAPTIDVKKKVLYVGTGNSYTNVSTPTSDAILAFDLETGSLLWSSQVLAKDNFTMGCGRGANCPEDRGPDHDFGTSPILRDLPDGKRVLVCGQKSGIVWGLDPDHRGKVLWQTRVGQGSALGGIEWGPTADLENAYVAVSDLLNRGEIRPGGLHALKLSTGEKIWTTPPPELHCTAGAKGCNSAQSAAISSIPGVVFSGSVDGHFRAFLAKTGEIVWDFNTARDFETVNGVAGKGGSLDSAGPVIAGGMVFTNSGYGMWAGLPGNVLLAFSK